MNRTLALEAFITFKGQGETDNLSVTSIEPKPWDKALPGQKVKLKAMYLQSPDGSTGLFAGPILKVTGKPTPTTTAEQLAKAFQADPEGAEEKFGSLKAGSLILTGEIYKAKEVDEEGVPTFFLKTGTKLSVKCGPDRQSAKGLAPGKKIKCIGACFGLKGKTEIEIVDCLVIELSK